MVPSATAERDGFRLIAVVLGAPSDELRFQDVSNLLNYGYANSFNGRIVVPADTEVTTAPVNRGQATEVPAAKTDLAVLLKKGESLDDIEHTSSSASSLRPSPLAIARVILRKGDDILAQTDLIATQDVRKLGFSVLWCDFCKNG